MWQNPRSQILRQHVNTTSLDTLSATNSCHYCCCASFQLQLTMKAWWELRDWLRIVEQGEMFFRAISWMSILPKWVHPYVQEQMFNKYIFRRVLSPTPGWFLLGPLEFKINDSAWQRAQKSTTGDCKSNGICVIWLTKWHNSWWDQKYFKSFQVPRCPLYCHY